MTEKRKITKTSFNIDDDNKKKAKENLQGAMDLNTFVNLCIAVVAKHEGAITVSQLLGSIKPDK